MLALGGCHVIRDIDDVRLGPVRTGEPGPTSGATAGAATALVDAGGALRLVRPSLCRAPQVQQHDELVRHVVSPNLATFVVGVVATSLGLIGTVVGLSDDDAAGHPLTYAGPVTLGTGLAFAIGPWLGGETTTSMIGSRQVEVGSVDVPCGDSPLTATDAVVAIDGHRSHGKLDELGRYAWPMFTWIDAFDAQPAAHSVEAWVDEAAAARGAPADVLGALDVGAVAGARAAFLATLGIDTSAPALDKIPEVSLARPTVRWHAATGTLVIGLGISNAGAGDAWHVRLRLTSSHRELDGRVIYVGRLRAGETVTPRLEVPLTDAGRASLVGHNVSLDVRGFDAHNTIRAAAARYDGLVLADMPGAP